MRLLNAETQKLQTFLGDDAPPYAILSHTWEGDEVTLQELQDPDIRHRKPKGFDKIKKCCEQTRRDGLDWVWIDSCCIDKTSSAELSEAINSMYRWYRKSYVCYVYLADVRHETLPASLRNSKWFTRGWTLQELIAPPQVEFYDQDWVDVGTRRSLVETLVEITRIPSEVLLLQRAISDFSAGARLAWAADRVTTIEEDMAYCLLGLFGINMPLLYGEGTRAFHRLQEEIIRASADLTVLLWSAASGPTHILILSPTHTLLKGSFLAPRPNLFRGLEILRPGFGGSLWAEWSQVVRETTSVVDPDLTESMTFTLRGLRAKIRIDGDGFMRTPYVLKSHDSTRILGSLCIRADFHPSSGSGLLYRHDGLLYLRPLESDQECTLKERSLFISGLNTEDHEIPALRRLQSSRASSRGIPVLITSIPGTGSGLVPWTLKVDDSYTSGALRRPDQDPSHGLYYDIPYEMLIPTFPHCSIFLVQLVSPVPTTTDITLACHLIITFTYSSGTVGCSLRPSGSVGGDLLMKSDRSEFRFDEERLVIVAAVKVREERLDCLLSVRDFPPRNMRFEDRSSLWSSAWAQWGTLPELRDHDE